MSWDAIKFVTSGLTLVAFIAAAVTWLLKAKQDSVERLIKGADKQDLPEILDTYLRGARVQITGLGAEAKERVALETIRATSTRYRHNAVVISLVAILVAIVAVVSVVVTASQPGAREPAKEANLFRAVIQSLTFGIKDGHPYFVAHASLGNIGAHELLLTQARFGVIATSRSDGSMINEWVDLAPKRSLAAGSIVPLELPNTTVEQWVQMGKPTAIQPTFEAYDFAFMLQIQTTDSASGRKTALDISMPRPASMTCDHQCISVFDLNVPAGATGYKTCTAVPAQVGWTLDCQTREES